MSMNVLWGRGNDGQVSAEVAGTTARNKEDALTISSLVFEKKG